jgi:hypothetical protein
MDGMMGDHFVYTRALSGDEVLSLFNGTVPSVGLWSHVRNQVDVTGSFTMVPQNSPEKILAPAGLPMPVNIGPGVLQDGQSLDLSSGESLSPFAQQLADLLSDLTHNATDDSEANAVFARLLNTPSFQGIDRFAVSLPAATGDKLAYLQSYALNV